MCLQAEAYSAACIYEPLRPLPTVWGHGHPPTSLSPLALPSVVCLCAHSSLPRCQPHCISLPLPFHHRVSIRRLLSPLAGAFGDDIHAYTPPPRPISINRLLESLLAFPSHWHEFEVVSGLPYKALGSVMQEYQYDATQEYQYNKWKCLFTPSQAQRGKQVWRAGALHGCLRRVKRLIFLRTATQTNKSGMA